MYVHDEERQWREFAADMKRFVAKTKLIWRLYGKHNKQPRKKKFDEKKEKVSSLKCSDYKDDN